MNLQQAVLSRFPALEKLVRWPKLVLLGAASALIALIVVALLWSQGPSYGVLYSDIDDGDGAAIISALSQLNVPYRFSKNGTTLLVPENRIYETRMQLAGQGLPRTGNAGFELLDNPRFGASQFSEQVNYQRALEGELARSIEAIHAVKSARVHLALPRESLFVRDQQPPTASVLLNLYPGRSLGAAQVSAIAWLVSSSVPKLHADEVSIVDQYGQLLSTPDGQYTEATQAQNYARDIEARTAKRISDLVMPLLGSANVRAQASADVDFSQREETSETYRPNQLPGQSAVRSKQINESRSQQPALASGIPGALSNQPPAPVEAPIENEEAQAAAPEGSGQESSDLQSDTERESASSDYQATINYEVDRKIEHIKEPGVRLRRLSVAVVVNYRENADGELVPLEESELDDIERLVKDAMGFSAARGDTLSVINSRFSAPTEAQPPFWENPNYQAMAWKFIKYALALIAFLLIWYRLIKPLAESFSRQVSARQVSDDTQRRADAQAAKRASEITRYEENLEVARELAEKDPRAVAMVLRSWMEKHEKP
ncbi:MAG TPA: flagellar basal-body MS-ring/collar protein FliF [Burkholderiaceae bacterium]|nr:flagellar basal-body MS-ring/collar protein FliF [Burkholderiaceae bacterium]